MTNHELGVLLVVLAAVFGPIGTGLIGYGIAKRDLLFGVLGAMCVTVCVAFFVTVQLT